MEILPQEIQFIKRGETWAIVGDSQSGHSELLQKFNNKNTELVGFRHRFRNLSNTTEFYYQQRYNSADSEDSLTVHEFLISQQQYQQEHLWTYGKVIRELQLEHLLDEQLIKLSNGETKRLLIAAALVKNPELLLLDHPLTGLDKKTRGEFSGLIDKITNSGIQVIIITDPHELPSAVTHVAVMKNRGIIFKDRKNAYRVEDFDFAQQTVPDEELLTKLVSHQPIKNFETIIRMTDVTVEYDGRKILRQINWHVKQGDRWSLSGPNGAGKSTLLSLVNGDNPQAYANNITLFDRKRGSGESIWDIKKQTGFVSPELYQYFPMDSSCLHVIESGFYDTIGLFRVTDPAKEAVCMDWMKLFGLENYSNALFSMVPDNVQRLCLLARALVKNPALLILDEPTQGLDISQQQYFTALIDKMCSLTNVTLIYVSHYEHHVPKAVTKYLRLENGRMVT